MSFAPFNMGGYGSFGMPSAGSPFQMPSYGGLLGADDQAYLRNQGLLGFGASLLDASGPSPVPISTGQALGRGILSMQQNQGQMTQNLLRNRMLGMQMQQAQLQQERDKKAAELIGTPAKPFVDDAGEFMGVGTPQGLLSEEGTGVLGGKVSPQALPYMLAGLGGDYTKAGLKGMGIGTDVPSNIREWQEFQKMTPQQQQQYLNMKRQGYQVTDIGGVPTLVSRTPGGQSTQLSSLQNEAQGQGAISGAKAAAEQRAKINAAAEIERQKLAGKGELPDNEKKRKAQAQVTTTLNEAAKLYNDLADRDAIVDTSKSTPSNILSSISASTPGQAYQKMVGTESQSIRNQINQIRPTLVNYIRQASEMGARGLDSEKELEFYLQAATDPKRDVQSNRAALKVLNDAYGLGTDIGPVDQDRANRLKEEFARQTSDQPSGGWGIKKVR